MGKVLNKQTRHIVLWLKAAETEISITKCADVAQEALLINTDSAVDAVVNLMTH